MKKIVLLLSIFLFCCNIYAESNYCYISKDNEENVILKNNDEIKVYFNNSYDYPIYAAKFKLYYNPYIFEIIQNGDEYIFHDESIIIKNTKVYSSIIEFEVEGYIDENKTFPELYVKFKVKEDAKDGETTIELVKNNSLIVQKKEITSGDVIEPEFVSEEIIKTTCFNSKLYYVIDNSSEEINNDSRLSYIGVVDNNGYLYPNFSPNIKEYDLYYESDEDSIYIESACSINNCEFEELKEVSKDSKVVILESGVGDNKTVYTINVVLPNYEYNEWPTLKSLNVMQYEIIEAFDEYTNTYHINVPDTLDSLLIDYESDYDVKILGNENLQIGENIVTIVVSNGEYENKYYLIVQKQEPEVIKERAFVSKNNAKEQAVIKEKSSNMVQNITIGLILLTTLIMITVFIVKDKEESETKE